VHPLPHKLCTVLHIEVSTGDIHLRQRQGRFRVADTVVSIHASKAQAKAA